MLVAFLAYVIKTTTGFGTAIVTVSLGSLLIGTYEAVLLSPVIDVIGGAILFYRDPVTDSKSFWIPLTIAMTVGSVIGAVVLKYIPPQSFDILVGAVIALLGFWFIISRSQKGESVLETTLPDRVTPADLAVSTFSGLCGGLFAVSGPPIVYWLGRRFAKFSFRRTLIAVFFFANIGRLIAYGAAGLLHKSIVTLALFSIPGIVLGIFLGDRIFHFLSEGWFSRIVGAMLLIVSIKLLWGYL